MRRPIVSPFIPPAPWPLELAPEPFKSLSKRGFHLIIGQSDKLRLMNLLMEDMKTYKDIAIKQCRECRFSNGGQYFAAVNTNATNAIQAVF